MSFFQTLTPPLLFLLVFHSNSSVLSEGSRFLLYLSCSLYLSWSPTWLSTPKHTQSAQHAKLFAVSPWPISVSLQRVCALHCLTHSSSPQLYIELSFNQKFTHPYTHSVFQKQLVGPNNQALTYLLDILNATSQVTNERKPNPNLNTAGVQYTDVLFAKTP